MSNEVEELSDSLAEFQRRFAQLPDVEEPPQTLLHVLRRETKETYWNKILSYFLDPTEPHGFGTDFLEAFLSLLEENSEQFNVNTSDFGELEVKSEWVMRDLEVKPDITIYSGRNWFVIIEMKVHASEHNDQTCKYVHSEKIGNIDKSEFGAEKETDEQRREEYENEEKSGHNYVYLAPRLAANAKAPEFVNISWREVVGRFKGFEHQSHGRYPAKSYAQLNDLLDTIRSELNMTDEKIEQNQIDKIQLYFEYANTIKEAEDALDKVHERERKTWQERFLNDFEPENWSDEWRCAPGDFGHIYHKKWRLTGEREQTEVNDVPYRISFVHDISERDSFRQGSLTFQLYCPRGADNDFTDEFSKRFHDNEEIKDFFQDRRNNGNKMWMTESEYGFEQEELPHSYYETLQTAFDEHQEIADEITRIFEESIDEIKPAK